MRVRVQQNTAVLVGRMAIALALIPVVVLGVGATPSVPRPEVPRAAVRTLAVFDPFAWPPSVPLALQIAPLPEPSSIPTEPCLHRIVIDAGHGGADEGTVGPQGLTEKDIVLDVALRLRALILLRLKTDVLLTRDNDYFVPLPERAEIANLGHADLFLSIHANSAPVQSAAGTETWFLNPEGQSDSSESRKVAETIQRSIFALAALSNSTAQNRGTRRAPFIVLARAEMPSILAEIGFLTNPADEFNLSLPEYRQRIAEALYAGVREYSLSRDLSSAAPEMPHRARKRTFSYRRRARRYRH